MSSEPDQDPFSLKRHRGGEGGLDDVLGTPGLLVGIPDKKRRKSSTQVPFLSSLSEYAPPSNLSSDHLIASNPFDDSYSLPSVKSSSSSNPYFSPSHYSGFSGYGIPRMAPHRMPSPQPYQMRNQPLSQNAMGFNRALGFNHGHRENPNHGHQFGMGQPFRLGAGENIYQNNPLNHSRGSEGVPRFVPDGSAKISPRLSQQQNNFIRFSASKQDPIETTSKNSTLNPSPRKQSQNFEDSTTQDSTTKHKVKGRGNTRVEKLNGVLHSNTEALKKSPLRENTDKTRKGHNNKVQGQSNRRSMSSEPVYPCGICLSEVKDDQDAILCEASCQKWFHRVCTGMTETAYNLLTAETSAVWGCDACMEDRGAQLLKTRDSPGTPSVTSDAQS